MAITYHAGRRIQGISTGGVTTSGTIQDVSYANKSVAVNGGREPWVGNNGTKMYTIQDNPDNIYEYTLSTAWDVTTATYIGTSALSGTISPAGLIFKPDGTKFFVGDFSTGKVHQYNLSTAWDISTISTGTAAIMTSPYGLAISSDGTQFYTCTTAGGGVAYQYNLSTAWDLSSTITSVSNISVISGARAITFYDDGTRFFVLDGYNSSPYLAEYTCTAWTLSTAVATGNTFTFTETTSAVGAFVADNNTRLYLNNEGGTKKIWQYDIAQTINSDYTRLINSPLAKATGGTITTNGNKNVHIFTSSGTFTPVSAFNVEYLVIGGGGGGANTGAGAGGYLTNTGYPVTSQSYSITVGSGGAGGSINGDGSDGGTSSIVPTSGTSITLTGGAGGKRSGVDGGNSSGASGSGGGADSNLTHAGGTGGTYGNAGGASSATLGSPHASGGGGGSGAAAPQAPNNSTGGTGGAGTSSSITGTAIFRAGGGGGSTYAVGGTGGTGGTGGGGAGSSGSASSVAGTVNTGSGGGGAGASAPTSGAGGSGIVIISYEGNLSGNAQIGSRFEETDTRKIYHYANPITFEDDFSDNSGWVKTGTKQDITGGKLTFTATRETTLQEESYNLGSALSTTWVCDFDLDITTFTSGGSSTGAVWFGLSSVDGTTSGSEEVGDYMGLGLYIGTNTDIVVFNTNGNAWNTTSANICAGCGATDLFYVRMIRDGDTITINFYPTDADRTAGTNSEKNGTKTTSGVTGLQYFRVGGRAVSGSFSATLLGSIDELKIWDGVTVVPTGNVWKEEGT